MIKNSVEENLLALQEKKQKQANEALDSSRRGGSQDLLSKGKLSFAELKELLR